MKRNVLIGKTPLVAIVMIALMAGAAFAAVYWTSTTFTRTVTVAGAILAKANVDVVNSFGGALADTWLKNYQTVPVVTDFKPIDKIYLLVNATNSATLYVSVTKVADPAITVVCTARLMHIGIDFGDNGYNLKFDKDLGAIVVGGASVNTAFNGDPLWLAKSKYTKNDPPESSIRIGMRLLELTFTFGGTPPIGSYPVQIVVYLGDNL